MIPISKTACTKLKLDETLCRESITLDFATARLLAQQIHQSPENGEITLADISAADLKAISLINQIYLYIINRYQKTVAPNTFGKLYTHLNGKHIPTDATLLQYKEYFPYATYQINGVDQQTIYTPKDSKLATLQEVILLWLTNNNPACKSYKILFDDEPLAKQTAYTQLIDETKYFFHSRPPYGPKNNHLIEMLLEPIEAAPDSLQGQLEYIRIHWGHLLGELLTHLLKTLDFIKEENKARMLGPGPVQIADYKDASISQFLEEERYSPDKDWMPRLVLLAKNTYVWLDQLSKKYDRPINTLDQIPDEELDEIASYGITGLWLIGVWERSSASRRIKQLCGNPDAVASAYSLYDYVVAHELGGEQAMDNLRKRAWQRGIRLAADMVPNHVGIYSKWVIEHPDWFISLDYSPFPNYSFNGVDLSEDPNIGIYLEDHYYSKTDAAVVFKRVDKRDGNTKFIYHGNDGTSMPWNDTAQLNYLNPVVRESVIQTILHVARQFPIIRFDAAMTLTKKHYQRLWFPEPGTGGDIPSRAEFGMTKEEFDKAMPNEFWREVVDRVAEEMPDTLLLAEAFWLMEGYFVRTLGMHRVYNSAFMHMLRDEKNAEYRQLIKNTLEFDPQILKRYVNFMNNPDEETAIAQFGKDDKYFGVCTLLATMPGLPMIGHGQIEGYSEKYGMEFRRAYWDEKPDYQLIERHKREIFPLFHQRYLFADVEHFRLFDLYTNSGTVDENVIAYTNRYEAKKALIVYHNRYAETQGWIQHSAAFLDKSQAEEKLRRETLAESLELSDDDNTFTIFRDHITGLNYIRKNSELYEKGLYLSLGAYKYHVFLDFREVQDNDWQEYRKLHDHLNGRGVYDIDAARRELILQPVYNTYRELVNAGMLHWLMENRSSSHRPKLVNDDLLEEVRHKSNTLIQRVSDFTQLPLPIKDLTDQITREVQVALSLLQFPDQMGMVKRSSTLTRKINDYLIQFLGKTISENPTRKFLTTIFLWLFNYPLANQCSKEENLFKHWLLDNICLQIYEEMGLDPYDAHQHFLLLNISLDLDNIFGAPKSLLENPSLVLEIFTHSQASQYLHINTYNHIEWFNKEAFEELVFFLFITNIIKLSSSVTNADAQFEALKRLFTMVETLLSCSETAQYNVAAFKESYLDMVKVAFK